MIQHSLHPRKLAGIDDATEIRRRLRAAGEELLAGRLHLGDEGIEHGLVDEDVVLADADLAGVVDLGPEQAPGREADVGVARHDGRVAAAEFEGDGREGLGGFLGDDFGHVAGPGVEDFVPFFVEQRRCLRDAAVDADVARRVEGVGHDFLDRHAGVGGVFAGFDDGGAAGSDGADQGADGELDGEVVGSWEERDQQSCEGALMRLTYPMMSTAPSGSFRIFGRKSLFMRGMSGALSSLIHFSRLSQTKIMSFLHQSISVR